MIISMRLHAPKHEIDAVCDRIREMAEGGKARPELTPLQRRSAIALPLRL